MTNCCRLFLFLRRNETSGFLLPFCPPMKCSSRPTPPAAKELAALFIGLYQNCCSGHKEVHSFLLICFLCKRM